MNFGKCEIRSLTSLICRGIITFTWNVLDVGHRPISTCYETQFVLRLVTERRYWERYGSLIRGVTEAGLFAFSEIDFFLRSYEFREMRNAVTKISDMNNEEWSEIRNSLRTKN